MPVIPQFMASVATSLTPITVTTGQVVQLVNMSGVAGFEYLSQGSDWYLQQFLIDLQAYHGIRLINADGLQWTANASLAAISHSSQVNSGWAIDEVQFSHVDMGLSGNIVVRGGSDTYLHRVSYHVQVIGHLERV